MRISDWSSDVCSSDLFGAGNVEFGVVAVGDHPLPDWGVITTERIAGFPPDAVRDLCARYDAIVVCEGSLFTSTFSDGLATMLTAFLGMAAALGKPAVPYGAAATRKSVGEGKEGAGRVGLGGWRNN